MAIEGEQIMEKIKDFAVAIVFLSVAVFIMTAFAYLAAETTLLLFRWLNG